MNDWQVLFVRPRRRNQIVCVKSLAVYRELTTGLPVAVEPVVYVLPVAQLASWSVFAVYVTGAGSPCMSR
jgi:hypothetical protein